MVNLEIDGKAVQIEPGKTLMDAANKLGIYVPHFCYHSKLPIAANCRMCLVQVEKAPKPLPACATPVAEGMKVHTHSEQAVTAQKGVMEFLLINHPLDCPICDQGGECQLQDLAVGYGDSASRYGEEKRVVVNKDLGPLISTDMTRCIHCTRCVRFGQQIGGAMELGMIGRGEHAEIIQFVGTTVDSELSGNMIDLCPVGALTSKPFRFSARTWELTRKPSVSPHCGLGSNLTVQVKNNKVMRVLPRENEALNECWLSDKDRFSYEALNSSERLTRPMVRENGAWREVDWQYALNFVCAGLKSVMQSHGAAQLGALASPHQTLEELYLLQKLMRGIGSHNVDFRLRQSDFRADAMLDGAPWLGMNVPELGALGAVLLVGSNIRKDHPLLAHRLRQAAKRGTQVHVLHAVDHDLAIRLTTKSIVSPVTFSEILTNILRAVQALKAGGMAGSDGIVAQRVAKALCEQQPAAILLGNMAQQHPDYASLHALAQQIAQASGAKLGFLGEAANSVGGYIAGCLPYDASGVLGLNAQAMLLQPRRGYLLLGAEPELDTHDAARAAAVMRQADFVVAMSAFKHASQYAQAQLPIAPFSETGGTFVSTDGHAQSFQAVVSPLGDARPAWKLLRVLANMLGLSGFEYDALDAVRQEIAPDLAAHVRQRLSNATRFTPSASIGAADALQRVGEIPIYQADALVRRAASLQKTADALAAAAVAHSSTLQAQGLSTAKAVRVKQGECSATLPIVIDDRVAPGCIAIPGAHPATAALGPLFGAMQLEPAS